MAAKQFSLDLRADHPGNVDRIARIETDIGSIKDRLEHHQDELDVVSVLAMRATGERVAWASLQGQLKKLAARNSRRLSATAAEIAAPVARLGNGRVFATCDAGLFDGFRLDTAGLGVAPATASIATRRTARSWVRSGCPRW